MQLSAPNCWLQRLPALPEEIAREPCDYFENLPGKNTLSVFIDGFNIWYRVPSPQLDIIKAIGRMLQISCCIMDDIQDNSELRRGAPAAHMVFGVPQAINSANYLLLKCVGEASKLSPAAVDIFTQGACDVGIGQAHDLHATFNGEVPSERDYIKMIDGKCGGFFRVAVGLMRDQATRNRDLDVEDFLLFLGRFYQTRDDYNNLMSHEYTKTKGHLSDLDEGKYSLMLIHSLRNSKEGTQLKSLLTMRARQGNLSPEQKDTVMKILMRSESMEYTLNILEELDNGMDNQLGRLENQAGERNVILRAVLEKLRMQ
ncbi:hypothetical protein TWF481_011857 [Arthrobotrys musiformis]|uniref:Uncharacterized protein n=1 Tax=Arthrobotrys musiformis TaxID=47236 RepID=A0AAV9VXC0_9PEZI